MSVTTHITIQKKKIEVDQRMNAKELLLAHFPNTMQGGQLIIHFGPGRSPVWIELQERRDEIPTQLREAS